MPSFLQSAPNHSQNCIRDVVQDELVPITFAVPAYNEEARIESVLTHATRWASDILVIDKSSTDRTAAIASQFGSRVRVITLPFSPQAESRAADWVRHAKHDWIFVATCSEIPTRNLVAAVSGVLADRADSCDLVMVPRRMYSLGIHHPASPWNVAYYPFLFHRDRAEITDKIHEHFKARDPSRTYTIPYAEDCCVYHFTHTSARRFVQVVADYAEVEASVPRDAEAAIFDCLRRLRSALPGIFRTGADWPGIFAAWAIYNLTNVLFIWEKSRGLDVPAYYKGLTAQLLLDEWGIPESPPALTGATSDPVPAKASRIDYAGQKNAERTVLISYWAACLIYGITRPRTVLFSLLRFPKRTAGRIYRWIFSRRPSA